MNNRALTSLLLLLTLAAFLLSLMAGKVWIWPNSWAADNADGWIFLELRLPRAVLGLCIGAVLGLSGAVLRVAGVAFVLCTLATLYPAWQAARTQPAEALRHD